MRTRALPLAVVLLAAATARADMLDQSFVVPNFQGDFTIYPGASFAQTFTVGLAGELSRVGFQVYKTTGATGDLTLEIRATSGGVPAPDGTAPLFSTTVPIASLPTIDDPFNSVPITLVDVSSAGIAVAPGDVLAIALRSPNGSGTPPWTLWRMGTDAYAGGAAFIEQNGSTTWSPFMPTVGEDAGFQTYVTAVPEPASLTLLGLGGVGLLVVARRRRG